MWLRTLLPTLSQASGPLLLSIKAHKGEILTVAAVDGGKNILSVGSDGRVVVWDGVTGASLRVLSEGTNIRTSAASPRAAKWAVLVRDGFEVIETGTGTVVAQREAADISIAPRHLRGRRHRSILDLYTASVWNTGTGQSYWLHSMSLRKRFPSRLSALFQPMEHSSRPNPHLKEVRDAAPVGSCHSLVERHSAMRLASDRTRNFT